MSEKTTKKTKEWCIYLLAIILPFIIVLILQTSVIKSFYIPSPSMAPTLEVGSRVIGTLTNTDSVTNGDIIFFNDTKGWVSSTIPTEYYLVKRVIAVGGQTIACLQGVVYLDGEPLNEPYAVGVTSNFNEFTVPEGKLFVMGDNRQNSADSRAYIGNRKYIDEEDVKALSWFTYWPLNQLSIVDK